MKNSFKTFTKCLKNIITLSDITGKDPRLLFQKQEIQKTLLGGIFSIIIIISMFAGVGYFGKELFIKSNPITIFSKVFDYNPREYNLTLKTFNLFFGVSDAHYQYYMDPTIYNIEVSWLNKTTYP